MLISAAMLIMLPQISGTADACGPSGQGIAGAGSGNSCPAGNLPDGNLPDGNLPDGVCNPVRNVPSVPAVQPDRM